MIFRIGCPLLLLAMFCPVNVQAHAELLDTSPANGDVIETPPVELQVLFSEPVSVLKLQLLNSERESVELENITNIDGEVRFKPVSPLRRGQYLLSFRVLSLDAHPISSSVGFAIGNLPAPLPEYSRVDTMVLALARINRTVHLSAILAVTGMVLFPLLFTFINELESKRQYLVNIAATVGLLTAVLGLGLWGVLLRETPIISLLEAESWSIAMSTSLGTSFALVVGGLMGIIMGNVLDPLLLPGRLSGLLGALIVIVSIGASGHAAGSGMVTSSVFVVHALMAGIWFGALWFLYRVLSLKPDSMLSTILAQFSKRVTWVVALLLICALTITWLQLGDPGQFIYTEYGNWLMLKSGLVTLVLILAAVNRWRISPVLS